MVRRRFQILRLVRSRRFQPGMPIAQEQGYKLGWGAIAAGVLGLSVLSLLPTGWGAVAKVTRSSHRIKTSADTKQNTGGPIQVIAAENFWGSIASQVGGNRVKVTSIITNPDTDPHDYEAKPTDARLVASAKYVIVNGAGYDAWGQKLLDANPVEGRKVLNIGDLVGKHEGDNPHLWYSPEYVAKAAKQITTDLESLDPADTPYFEQQNKRFNTVTLKPYHQLLGAIKQKYQGTPVGSTESIFVYMADALGLNLTTPPAFMNAIAENQDPTAADKATFDQQISQKQIKVLVYNKQTVTPDTTVLEQKAQASGIPIVGITETLAPPTLSFQAWQNQQLQALQQALAKSTGR